MTPTPSPEGGREETSLPTRPAEGASPPVLRNSLDALRSIFLTLGTIAFIGFFISLILQVFFRYVLARPLTWSEEAARFLNVWTVLLGGVVAVARREHLGVDVLTAFLQKRRSRALPWLNRLVTLLIAASALFLLKGSWPMMIDRWNIRFTALPATQGMAYLALVIAAAGMSVFALYQLLFEGDVGQADRRGVPDEGAESEEGGPAR